MNNSVTKVLVALRSGEYRQDRGMMRCARQDGPSYCFMGVIVDVFFLETGRGHWDSDGTPVVDGVRDVMHLIPRAAMVWIGVPGHLQVAAGPETFPTLCVEKNDREGLTLAEMADWLEGIAQSW